MKMIKKEILLKLRIKKIDSYYMLQQNKFEKEKMMNKKNYKLKCYQDYSNMHWECLKITKLKRNKNKIQKKNKYKKKILQKAKLCHSKKKIIKSLMKTTFLQKETEKKSKKFMRKK